MKEEEDEESRVRVRWAPIGKKKLCPVCLGELVSASSLNGWLLPQQYRCRSCGYVGPVALEGVKVDKATSDEK